VNVPARDDADHPFAPRPWTSGGHRQTLLGFWHRRRLAWTLPTEDLVVEPEPDVRVLVRASWRPGERGASPALVLVHGLGGCDASGHLLATGAHAWSRGWHVLRMNMRGAGDAEALCPRLYNAGLDGDLVAVLQAAARVTPRVAVAGFSLGGSLTLLALGRRRAELPAALGAAAAVSPPLDLAVCAASLERRANRMYQHFFVRELCRAYESRQRRRPDLYERGRARGVRTVREFDAAVTAPYGGYRDVDDYYARCSAGPHLASIAHPTLVLAAQDDPMIPCSSVSCWTRPDSGPVRFELTRTGGHAGFVDGTRLPGRFWAAGRVLSFLEDPRRS
jgi:predicted alpha/beta-fold hydrolase